MSLPFGDVVLDDSGPVVFASAGVGITPMAGMLSHLTAAGSHLPITLLHADVDEESFALRHQVLDDLRELPGASAHVWYERGARQHAARRRARRPDGPERRQAARTTRRTTSAAPCRSCRPSAAR